MLFFWLKRGIGIALVLKGVYLVIAQPLSQTGAVIDISTPIAKLSGFIGLICIIGGIFLIKNKKIEKKISKHIEKQIKNNITAKQKV